MKIDKNWGKFLKNEKTDFEDPLSNALDTPLTDTKERKRNYH